MAETLEAKYKRQLGEMGVYQPAFDGTISMLCQMEREIRRVDKAWRAECVAKYGTKEDGKTPKRLDYAHELHEKIEKMRRDILTYRESLGLTPKGFKRLRPEAGGPAGVADPQNDALAKLEAMCRGFDGV